MTRRAPLRAAGLAFAALALLAVAPGAEAAARRTARSSSRARPDAALYREAQAAEARLRGSPRRLARRGEWEAVVLAYRKVVARYPRSGYCDNALLLVGTLYREMARRFHAPQYREDALAAYRLLVAEYPSSSLGEQALWASLEMARDAGMKRRVSEAARAYLDTYPDGRKAAQVKRLLRRGEPSTPLPSPPPPGLAKVYDLRSWSGESSTRIVIDLERRVPYVSDRVTDPDRLWIDLKGTRLHPNLEQRVFPVGDGLLEQVRIGKNRDDVVRVVLDFKDVWEHQLFYLDNPIRLVIDVRGQARPGPQLAAAPPVPAQPQGGAPSGPTGAGPAAAGSGTASPTAAASAAAQGTPAGLSSTRLPQRPLDAMVQPTPTQARGPARGAEPSQARPAARPAPLAEAGAVASSPPAPEPPSTNRAGSYSLARQLGLGARRIVIDAGHGGHDPGTIGRAGLEEKDLVLDVALRLDRLVRQELGTEVILTRSTDVFVPLEERTAIANSRGADLFLSIHANASRSSSARGIETYFLSFARSPHAEAVAARENAISPATLKDLQGLVKAIMTNSKIAESRDFAGAVHESMVSGMRRQHTVADRGVHTAPFYVLIGANMPSVLAEIAFLSNPEDERRLKTSEYRDVLARSLLTGVRGYLDALNRTQLRQLTDGSRRSNVGSRGLSR